MAQEFIIRPVEMQDYQPLSELYGYYSLNTVYTYYSHCPTAEYMQQLFSGKDTFPPSARWGLMSSAMCTFPPRIRF